MLFALAKTFIEYYKRLYFTFLSNVGTAENLEKGLLYFGCIQDSFLTLGRIISILLCLVIKYGFKMCFVINLMSGKL